MKLKLDELPPQIRKINPALFGHIVDVMEKPKPKSDIEQALGCCASVQQGCAKRVVVSIVRYARRELDSDNLAGGAKHLRDCIAATLGVDDADKRIVWQYGQVRTAGEEGTAVKIEMFV